MDWDVKRDGRALQRIVALLLALADIAERTAAMPFARRAVILAILWHAEAVAWAFALGIPCVSTASGRDHRQLQNATLPGIPAGGLDGPADAVRMASGLRMLALLFAGWATESLSSAAVESPVRRAISLMRPGSGGSWRGPAPLPAPDTS
ncbi:MAG: hypothetical protein WDZ83_06700 [Rhizobiaceae bacterium]